MARVTKKIKIKIKILDIYEENEDVTYYEILQKFKDDKKIVLACIGELTKDLD